MLTITELAHLAQKRTRDALEIADAVSLPDHSRRSSDEVARGWATIWLQAEALLERRDAYADGDDGLSNLDRLNRDGAKF